MADTALDEKRIHDEAAQWYARLNNTTISTDTLRAFREWRKDERNAHAYEEIDAFWQRASKVRNDPEIQQAVGAALAREKKTLGPLPRPGGKSLAAALLIVLLGLITVFAWPRIMGRAYETGVGEQRFVTLEDGSRLKLDTHSKVRVRLAAHLRQVQLVDGRAYFEVAHDAARPFIVRADGTEVRAIGTKFDVRRDAASVAVTLLEGKVRVDGQAANKPMAWTLAPGQQVVVGPAAARPAIRNVDAGLSTSWTNGRLIFRDQPLSAAIAEVNRYSRRKIVLNDPALAARPVTGAFDVGDTAAFVAAVSDLFSLEADTQAKAIVLKPAA